MCWGTRSITSHAITIRNRPTNGAGKSYGKRVKVSNTNSISSEPPSLHELLSSHWQKCLECHQASKRPRGLGEPSPYCFEYREIIRLWAMGEGAVNNIVSHDEYGHEAGRSGHPDKPVIMP